MCADDEVRADASILYHGSESSIYDVMLPPGDKDTGYKLCVTVEGIDAFLAKTPVTIAIRVSPTRTSSLVVAQWLSR